MTTTLLALLDGPLGARLHLRVLPEPAREITQVTLLEDFTSTDALRPGALAVLSRVARRRRRWLPARRPRPAGRGARSRRPRAARGVAAIAHGRGAGPARRGGPRRGRRRRRPVAGHGPAGRCGPRRRPCRARAARRRRRSSGRRRRRPGGICSPPSGTSPAYAHAGGRRRRRPRRHRRPTGRRRRRPPSWATPQLRRAPRRCRPLTAPHRAAARVVPTGPVGVERAERAAPLRPGQPRHRRRTRPRCRPRRARVALRGTDRARVARADDSLARVEEELVAFVARREREAGASWTVARPDASVVLMRTTRNEPGRPAEVLVRRFLDDALSSVTARHPEARIRAGVATAHRGASGCAHRPKRLGSRWRPPD